MKNKTLLNVAIVAKMLNFTPAFAKKIKTD
jgi:hypothetical protein